MILIAFYIQDAIIETLFYHKHNKSIEHFFQGLKLDYNFLSAVNNARISDYLNEKYGYIMPLTKEEVSKVSGFKEKPDSATAQKYIDAGGLWNGGVFAYQLGYVLNRSKDLLGTNRHSELYANYDQLKKISFDYAVVEKAKNMEES